MEGLGGGGGGDTDHNTTIGTVNSVGANDTGGRGEFSYYSKYL